jgi:dipeptidyl aminopeptidase/acylaminoacyl peptidase
MPDQRLVEPADLFRLKFVTGAAFSPDGTRAAYTVSNVDAEAQKEYSTIYVLNLATGESRPYTDGTAKDGAPQWSPDGRRIAFISNRADNKPQVYVLPVDGGEARALTSLKQGVGGGIAWSPDGTQIAFTAATAEEARDQSKPYRIDRFIYRFDTLEYLDDAVQSLYVVGADGGEARKLTDDRLMSSSPQWSPDGRELLYSASMDPDSPLALHQRLRVIDVATGAIREITGDWGSTGSAAWTPDGQRIVFTGTQEGLPIGTQSDLYVIDRDGGTPECRSCGLAVGVDGSILGDMPVSWGNPRLCVTRDGASVYAHVQDGGTLQIYRFALSGAEAWEPVVSGDRALLLLGANDDTLLYIASSINQPPDLYVSDVNGANERQLTHVNDAWIAGIKQPGVEHLRFPGEDGAQVEGWLITPPEGEAPYPTILFIHGGPHLGWGHIFHFDTQMLCGAGYAVLMINHRASTGYGDAFATAIKGAWGTLDYTDLMAGVDYAIGKGLVDGDRLGCCGRSGGGNLSCWIVGQTDRFKAAVPENPVTNWVSFYGVSDIGVWFSLEELGGHPHEIPEVYARCSPITFAHRCKTPTLLVQGEHDWRCPPEQSEQFYTVLKANGCKVEMLRMPNSSHQGALRGPLAVRTVHNDALLGWMNKYVLGKES